MTSREEATRAEVEQFALDTGSPVGRELVEFWLAGKDVVIMVPATWTDKFHATPFALAKRDLFGYESEMMHRFCPQAGQVVNHRFAGTCEAGAGLARSR